jgi:hypothetical protein
MLSSLDKYHLEEKKMEPVSIKIVFPECQISNARKCEIHVSKKCVFKIVCWCTSSKRSHDVVHFEGFVSANAKPRLSVGR